MDDELKGLRPHPAAGHLAVEKSHVTEIIREPVTDLQIARARERMNQQRQHDEPELPGFLREMFGDNIRVARVGPDPTDLTDDQIRGVLSEGMCAFEAGIVIEVGYMPTGADELGYCETGCKVYFHENRGHTIGELTFLSIEQIIAWE